MGNKPIRHVETIPNGDAGIDAIVAKMWGLIYKDRNDPSVLREARKLKKQTDYRTIEATFNYVWKNYKYVPDPVDSEHLTAPRHIIARKTPHMDCDEMVVLLVSLLQANGIPGRIITIAWRKKDFSHVIASAKIGNIWILLDPTKKRAGFGGTVSPMNKKFWRLKNYGDPMGKLTTLDDCGGCRKGKKGLNNEININIGNTNSKSLGKTGKDRIIQLPGQVKTLIKKVPVIYKQYVPMPTKSNYAPGLVIYREYY